MTGDDLQLLGLFPEIFRRFSGNKFVAGAVRAVSSHFVFLIICVIYGVHIRIFGHREMESRVEDQSHGRFGHRRAAGLDADDCGGIVQGARSLISSITAMVSDETSVVCLNASPEATTL